MKNKNRIAVPVCVLAAMTFTLAAGAKTSAVANPWREVTEKEMSRDYGYNMMIPEDAENTVYSIETVNGLAQAGFTFNDVRFILRMKHTDKYRDISGLYYDWDDISCESISGMEVTERVCGDKSSCLWYDDADECMYSIYVSGDNADMEDAEQVIMEMYM